MFQTSMLVHAELTSLLAIHPELEGRTPTAHAIANELINYLSTQEKLIDAPISVIRPLVKIIVSSPHIIKEMIDSQMTQSPMSLTFKNLMDNLISDHLA